MNLKTKKSFFFIIIPLLFSSSLLAEDKALVGDMNQKWNKKPQELKSTPKALLKCISDIELSSDQNIIGKSPSPSTLFISGFKNGEDGIYLSKNDSIFFMPLKGLSQNSGYDVSLNDSGSTINFHFKTYNDNRFKFASKQYWEKRPGEKTTGKTYNYKKRFYKIESDSDYVNTLVETARKGINFLVSNHKRMIASKKNGFHVSNISYINAIENCSKYAKYSGLPNVASEFESKLASFSDYENSPDFDPKAEENRKRDVATQINESTKSTGK